MSSLKLPVRFKLPQPRYLALPAMVWLLCALWAWHSPLMPAGVVGVRKALPSLAEGSFESRKLESTFKQIAQANLWGLTPDGKPLEPPQSAVSAPVAGQQWVQWKLLAASVRPNNAGLIIVQAEPDAPLTVRIGEKLPDGSTLQSVNLDRIVVKPLNKPARTILLSSE